MPGELVNSKSSAETLYRRFSLLLLALTFALIVCKAWTQSITIDEVFTYDNWVAAPFSSFYHYTGGAGSNNHPLNTLLCRLSTAILPLSEFTLRLPNVLLSLLYLASIYGIALRCFGSSIWLPLTVALNCAQPLIVDHFALARGYGMGLAFWSLGTLILLRGLAHEGNRWSFIGAGVALGLSVGSFLTEAFAVAALTLTALLIHLARYVGRDGWRGVPAFLTRVATPLAAAELLVGVPLVWGPLRMARENIYGDSSYKIAVKRFLEMIFFYRRNVLSGSGLVWRLLHKWPWSLLLIFGGMLLIAIAAGMFHWIRKGGFEKLSVTERQLLLLAPTLLLTFGLLRLEPAAAQHAFFDERRLLFTFPLLFLTCPLWLYWLGRQGRPGLAASRTGALALGLCAIYTASQFTLESFYGWQFDAGAKRIANVLRQHRPQALSDAPRRLVRVGANAMMSHSLEFYRRLYGMDWIAPLTRAPFGCFYDYYVVGESDAPQINRFHPQVLYRDPVARSLLAEPGSDVRAHVDSLRQLGFTRPLSCQADLARREPTVSAIQGRTGGGSMDGSFLADVMDGAAGDPDRWTFERPAFYFDVANRERLRFHLDLLIPPVTFKETGPQRLTVWVNGFRLGEESYTTPEDHAFERPVPAEWIRPDGVTVVETTLDKYYVAPADGQKLGYLFVRAAFVN